MPVTPNNEIYASAGCKVSIGTTAAISFTTDAAALTAFKADTFVEVKSMRDFDDIGGEAEVIEFKSLNDPVRRVKGVKDTGVMEMTVARNPTDPGQVAMRAAYAAGNVSYNFKVELTDAQTGGTGNNSAIYFRALVSSAKASIGSTSDVTLEKFKMASTSKPIFDIAA